MAAILRCSSRWQFRLARAYGISAIVPEQVAVKLLSVGDLKPGDTLVQNDANSEIGKAVIKLAKEQQITTINIIPDKPGALDGVEALKELGGDVVVTESYTNTWYMRRLLSDIAKPILGINFSSEGPSSTAVARLLSPGATLVTYGAELPQRVAYPGASRRPVKWAEFLKTKKLQAETL